MYVDVTPSLLQFQVRGQKRPFFIGLIDKDKASIEVLSDLADIDNLLPDGLPYG